MKEAVVIAALMSTACSPDQAALDPLPEQSDIGIRLELLTMVGPESGYEYGVGRDADILPDGRVVYMDQQSSQVHIFSSTGTYLKSFGGPGGGPGEFKAAYYVETGPGGQIAVSDFAQYRVTVFDSAGATLHTLRSGFPSGRPTLHWGPQGLFVHMQGDTLDADGNEVWVNATFRATLESTHEEPPTRPRLVRDVTVPLDFSVDSIPVTSGGGAVFTGPNGGMAFAAGTPLYRVVELDLNRNVLGVWERTDRPAPIYLEEEITRMRSGYETLRRELGGLGDSNLVWPTHRQQLTYDGVGFDDEGRMWTLPSVVTGQRRVIDVLDQSGLIASIDPVIPPELVGGTAENGYAPDLTSIKVRGRHLIGITKDIWDVPVILVWRIVN